MAYKSRARATPPRRGQRVEGAAAVAAARKRRRQKRLPPEVAATWARELRVRGTGPGAAATPAPAPTLALNTGAADSLGHANHSAAARAPEVEKFHRGRDVRPGHSKPGVQGAQLPGDPLYPAAHPAQRVLRPREAAAGVRGGGQVSGAHWA